MSVRLRDLDRLFARAEHLISLLDRCRPINADQEHRRVLDAWRRGEAVEPSWRYGAAPDLTELLRRLEGIAGHRQQGDPWAKLYAERADELALEARAVENLGNNSFGSWAARRFAVDTGEDGETAAAWARSWCEAAAALSPPADDRHPSDDETEPRSLYCLMLEAVGRARVPFRVLRLRDLPSAAATGDGVILVRAGVSFTEREARRIVLHEIFGHVLPRLRAKNEQVGLYAVGSARGSDDEEGHALLLEQRAGYLDAMRCVELGRRHFATLALREGADWVETVRLMQRLGADLTDAVRLAARAHRGGGLGREVVYLTALSRVRRELNGDPELESYLERGRVSTDAARVLRELGEPPETIDTKSAA